MTPKSNIAQVISAYSKRLLGFIRKRVTTEADAEDILQDVFFKFLDNTQPIEQLTGWLFTVARNKITDKQRKKAYETLANAFDGDGENNQFDWKEILFDQENNPETAYLRSMFWEELSNALDELPPEQKQVFILHELDGISFKQIALLTGESVNTLISRKRYAVLHLRLRLRKLRDELLNY
ncbi:MAG: sigma-70 family RNA polymerase sigma factor [Chitinophagaceae bacterium]